MKWKKFSLFGRTLSSARSLAPMSVNRIKNINSCDICISINKQENLSNTIY